MKTASVVVTTHQGQRFLGTCLRALEKTELPPGWVLEPIVVDNGSTDGTEVFLRNSFPKVRSLIHAEPLGFARANNAARAASTGDVVVFLNNDTEATPGWLKRPIELLEADPEIAAVGAQLIFQHRFRRCRVVGRAGGSVTIASRIFGSDLDNKIRWSGKTTAIESTGFGVLRTIPVGESFFVPDPIPGLDPPASRPPVVTFITANGDRRGLDVVCGGEAFGLTKRFPQAKIIPQVEERVDLIQAAGGFITRQGDGGDFASGEVVGECTLTEALVPSLCGAALIARRTALDAVGWFPEDYVVYYEDTHLSMLLRARAGLLVFCPSSIVRHYHTGTNREYSPFFVENVARSRLTFAAHFGSSSLLSLRLRSQAGWSARELFTARDRPLSSIWKSAHGFRGMVKSLPAVLKASVRRASRNEFHQSTSPLSQLTIDRFPYVSPCTQKGTP